MIRDRNIVWKPHQAAHEKRCEGCRNADGRTAGKMAPDWRDCMRHGFRTFTHAVCSDYQPIEQESAS